jgi:uncharacterized membrane protein
VQECSRVVFLFLFSARLSLQVLLWLCLVGVVVGAAVGGLTGALIWMGIPEYIATRYEGLIKRGSILFSVHAYDSNCMQKAKTILERTGADNIALT